jgi:hypothetical protein
MSKPFRVASLVAMEARSFDNFVLRGTSLVHQLDMAHGEEFRLPYPLPHHAESSLIKSVGNTWVPIPRKP